MGKSEWKEGALAFAVANQRPWMCEPDEYSAVLKRVAPYDVDATCRHARLFSCGQSGMCVVVLGWTLSDGLRVVSVYQGGESVDSAAYWTRYGAYRYAPLLMPLIADYLSTQARSMCAEPDAPSEDDEFVLAPAVLRGATKPAPLAVPDIDLSDAEPDAPPAL